MIITIVPQSKCEYCDKLFKSGAHIEMIYNPGGYYIYFCLGHMEKWAKEKRRSFLLEKL